MNALRLSTATIALLLAGHAAALPITATTGSDFTIYYDSIGGEPPAVVNGLTGEVRFYDFSFAANGSNTDVTFGFDIFNSSQTPVATSRISTLGFNTTPNIVMNSASNDVAGIFDTIAFGGNVPNQGTVE